MIQKCNFFQYKAKHCLSVMAENDIYIETRPLYAHLNFKLPAPMLLSASQVQDDIQAISQHLRVKKLAARYIEIAWGCATDAMDYDFRVGLSLHICPLHGQCDFEFSIFVPFLYFAFQIALQDLANMIPFRAWCCCCGLGVCFCSGGSDSFFERFLQAGEMFSEFVRMRGLFCEMYAEHL